MRIWTFVMEPHDLTMPLLLKFGTSKYSRSSRITRQSLVNGVRPIAVLQEEHLQRRRIVRILEEAEGMPLLVVDPWDIDVRVPPPARGRRPSKSIRNPHGHAHAGRQYVEGRSLYLFAHEEVHVASVEGVQHYARTEDGGYVTPVGDGVRRYVEAKSDGEEVK